MALSLAKLHVALDAAQQIDMAQNIPVMNTSLESTTGSYLHGYPLTYEPLPSKDRKISIINEHPILSAYHAKSSST